MQFEHIKGTAEHFLAAARNEYDESVRKSLIEIYEVAEKSDGVEARRSVERFIRDLDLNVEIPLDFLMKGADRHDEQKSLTDELSKTVSQFEQLQPAGLLSKSVSYLSRVVSMAWSLRDTLKLMLPKLFATGNVRSIDQALSDVLCAKAKLLSSHLGVITALNLHEETFTADVEQGNHFVMFSRHEVCTNLTKVFGLSEDTDLTALNPSKFDTGVQSRLELYAARTVKETMAVFINRLYANSFRVRAISSPVSRALSTATDAGLDADHVHEFHVSHHFSEQKLGSRNPSLAFFSPYVTSGTECSTPEEIESRLHKLQYQNVTVSQFTRQDSIRSTQETSREYGSRVAKAAEELNLDHNPELNRITWVFAHGDLLKDLAQEVTTMKMPKLDYGDTYLMMGEGSKQHCVGIMSRFGVLKHQFKPELVSSHEDHSTAPLGPISL